MYSETTAGMPKIKDDAIKGNNIAEPAKRRSTLWAIANALKEEAENL